jgi:hypothetical protein
VESILVSARIKNSARIAFYVHCNTHCLNLVLIDAVKSVPEAVNFHLKWLTVLKELYPQQQPRELQRFMDVRWVCRYMACRNLRDRLPAVLIVLQHITLENSGDR